jgi:hypothetical protein
MKTCNAPEKANTRPAEAGEAEIQQGMKELEGMLK